MRIVADENIAEVRDAFTELGDVSALPATAISRAVLRDADVLLVRSVTTVHRALLHGTSVRFVATATAGVDHVDTAYLDDSGIGFASAPGSNARAVAEYIVTALVALETDRDTPLSESSIGIVGVGHVGSRVAQLCGSLGMDIVLNDPPLAERTGDAQFESLERALDCDFVTLHTPLTDTGAHPTLGLVNASFLDRMNRGAVLLNASRGAVVDEAALRHSLAQRHLAACVLDVWQGEPGIDPRTLDAAMYATPHIAGYTLEAKRNGTQMIFDAVRDWANADARSSSSDDLPKVNVPDIATGERPIDEVLSRVFDIRACTNAMKRSATSADGFRELRKSYPLRREFAAHSVPHVAPDADEGHLLQDLGFALDKP